MLTYLLEGGPIMIPLTLLSVLSVAIIIDRMRAFRAADMDTLALRVSVTDALELGDLDGAIENCEAATGPVASVLLAGLSKYRSLVLLRRAPTECEIAVSKTMEDFAPSVLADLEKRLNLLVMIASVSPLLGMTGTVTGMIKSFNKMSEMTGLETAAVAGGISEALITTAAGLIIAIPAVVAYNIFHKRVGNYVIEIEQTVSDVLDFISLKHRH